MVFLRSRTRTGSDKAFHTYSHLPSTSYQVLRYPMRILECRVFDAHKEVLFAPYIGYVGHTLGFSGEGRTVHATAEDTCRKLISYIESRVAGDLPPYDPHCIERHIGCMRAWGKYDQEIDMELIDGCNEMEWGERFDCQIVAELDEGTGIVKLVGWFEERTSLWHIWREPGFLSLS